MGHRRILASVVGGLLPRAGAVASLEGVKSPTKVARLVMETTDHVLLVGPGARHFATMNGFAVENLLTEKARKVWLFWKQNLSEKDKWLEPDPAHYDPEVKAFLEEYGWDDFRKPQSGGTIHLSAVDARGDLGGSPAPPACSSRCRGGWATRRSSARAASPTTPSDRRGRPGAARPTSSSRTAISPSSSCARASIRARPA